MSHDLIEQTYDHLQTAQRKDVSIGTFVVHAARTADLQTLYLATPVFSGRGYLPGSVRAAVGQAGLISTAGRVRAALIIDEAAGEISLHYQVSWEQRDSKGFTEIFEEFLAVADEWHRLLDEYGQEDLVWVPRT